MPNKKRNAKLKLKLLTSGQALNKSEHVKATLSKLIEKSRIKEEGEESEDSENEQDNQTIQIEALKQPPIKTNLTKKSKKNKYYFLAHPEEKKKIENIEEIGKKFVINKETVEKVKSKNNQETHDSSNASNGKSAKKTDGKDDYATLWKLEPCTSSEDEENDKGNDTNNKKRKKNKSHDEIPSTDGLEFEKKIEKLADGSVVETYVIKKKKKQKTDDDDEDEPVEENDEEQEEDDEEEEEESEEEQDEEEQVEEKPVDKKKKKKNDKKEPNDASDKLQSSRFRYLNELLYTQPSDQSFEYFKSDSDAFTAYHRGFQQQTIKWPENPLETIVKWIKTKSSNLIIADFGCGEAKLAQTVKNKVHSFDFIALNDLVTQCDMKNVPLNSKSCDIVVFCLSLMGTNIIDFICEAHRVLKLNGTLKIAEVTSRFDDVNIFVKNIESVGFRCLSKDVKTSNYFNFFDFIKTSDGIRSKPIIKLLPCLYKKR